MSVISPVAAAFLALVTHAIAQPPADEHERAALALLVKGSVVTLKFPTSLATIDGISTMRSIPIFAANVKPVTPYITAVEGNMDWQTAGFPSMWEFKVEKIDRRKDRTEVELRGESTWLKLRFPPDIPAGALALAFSNLVLPGGNASAAADQYRQTAYAALAKKFFTGELASIPAEKQAILVRFAHITAEGVRIRSQSYKEKLYLVVELGDDTSVYNDLKFSQGTLIAHVLNERLLKTLKAFAEPVKDVTVVHGLKLEFGVPHKSLIDQTASPKISKLELYAPSELIRKFADADITNQQFIDGCVVIVDDNRIQVPLSGSGS